MPRVIMLSRDRFPSERAHSINQIRMCDGFADNGREVMLLYPDHAYNLPGDLHEFYGLRNQIKAVKVPCLAKDIPLPSWLKNGHVERLKNIFITDVAGATTTLSIIRHLYRMIKRGEVDKCDIIYGRSGYFALFLAKILLQILGKPNKVASEIHHPPYGRAGIIEFFLKRLDHIFVINSYLLDVFHARRFKNVTVVPDGVDIVPFDALRLSSSKTAIRERLGLPADRRIVVYAGHLYPYKGVEDLLHVAAALPDATFLIVGGYPEDVTRCKTVVASLDVSNVLFTGFIHPSAVPAYLLASDVCVYTLRPDAPIRDFTSPIKLFEYLASGNPTVAADVHGVRDVIRHNLTGLLYPPGDTSGMTDAIDKLLHDETLSSHLALNGNDVARHHSWTVRAKNILEILSD